MTPCDEAGMPAEHPPVDESRPDFTRGLPGTYAYHSPRIETNSARVIV